MWLCPKLVDILDENYKHYGLTVAGIVLVCAGFVVTVIAAAPLYAASEIMQLKKKAETTAQTDEARAYWREEYEFKFNSFNRSVELLSIAAFTTVNDVQIRPLLRRCNHRSAECRSVRSALLNVQISPEEKLPGGLERPCPASHWATGLLCAERCCARRVFHHAMWKMAARTATCRSISKASTRYSSTTACRAVRLLELVRRHEDARVAASVVRIPRACGHVHVVGLVAVRRLQQRRKRWPQRQRTAAHVKSTSATAVQAPQREHILDEVRRRLDGRPLSGTSAPPAAPPASTSSSMRLGSRSPCLARGCAPLRASAARCAVAFLKVASVTTRATSRVGEARHAPAVSGEHGHCSLPLKPSAPRAGTCPSAQDGTLRACGSCRVRRPRKPRSVRSGRSDAATL